MAKDVRPRILLRGRRAAGGFFSRDNAYMDGMRTHPHAEATYSVVPLAGGAFGVKVEIPDTAPTTVSSFDSEAAAEAWITRTKERIATEGAAGKWFQRRMAPRSPPSA
jgi:hypothetical protein